MIEWQNSFEKWKKFDLVSDLRIELNHLTEEQRQDAFYKDLEFGTGGMRGLLGVGTNRLNIYTVRKATEGLARVIEMEGEAAKGRGVVIAHDPRHMSEEFTYEIAKVLGKHKIKTYLFDELRPTPMLSFTVRYLKAQCGIVVTASHNPPKYNGYKIYNSDGCQLVPEEANKVIEQISQVNNELTIPVEDISVLKDNGLLQILNHDVDDAYTDAVSNLVLDKKLVKANGNELKIVFSPFNGTSNKPMRTTLAKAGFSNITIVKEQEQPDPDFSTLKSPNPEEHAAFELSMRYGQQKNADILIATDPDADRLGVAARNTEGKYEVFTGNQIGAILLEYILTKKSNARELTGADTLIKTIVTSNIGEKIAAAYGVRTLDALTGFKFIGDRIKSFKESINQKFIFGYEESYGYLIGDFVRDKDSIQPAVIISEIALVYKKRGLTLWEHLDDIFKKYGYFLNSLHSITLNGEVGQQKINDLLNDLRNNPVKSINNVMVTNISDFSVSKSHDIINNIEKDIELPKSNVIKYELEDNSWFAVRPSGTEPKIKFYFEVVTRDNTSEEKMKLFMKKVLDLFQIDE